MKFSQFEYQRPELKAFEAEMNDLLTKFEQATTAQEQIDLISKINDCRNIFDTMSNIAHLKYTLDTTNEAYQIEQDYFDQNSPFFQSISQGFYRKLVKSNFRAELEAHWGKQLFALAESALRIFDDSIIAELQRENQLASEYQKLMASAKIPFEGEERNLSQLMAFETSPNRETRRLAIEAKWQFFADNAEQFNRIFDDLVKVRHQMAVKLGFENFVPLGYLRMNRTDYNASMVAGYRQQVLEVIVPIAQELRHRQQQRLEVSALKHYDLKTAFNNGNAKPKGSPEWILANGKKMYEQLSAETGEFYNFMLNNELMDVTARKGKAGGGYCTYIVGYDSPFIFSNFNGTSDDITVLTHEAGHAFQVYMSRNWDMPEYLWPTYEAAEIHSMSMEFFTWPWMNLFFEEDTDKFKFEHLNSAVLFLPYGVSVDEFQHFIYENPQATPAERNQMWRKIEQKYQPWLDYDNNEFLEQGGAWQRQHHIYAMPFYYIDYTLAQICAFQFWNKFLENRQTALADYIRLCKAGGSMPFLDLVKYANLQSPFNTNCLKDAVQPVKRYLEEVNDAAL